MNESVFENIRVLSRRSSVGVFVCACFYVCMHAPDCRMFGGLGQVIKNEANIETEIPIRPYKIRSFNFRCAWMGN